MKENELMEVNFYDYCKTCKYENRKAHKDPCNECLEHGMNRHSRKPVNWKEKK